MVKPVPALKVAGLPVMITPRSKSPAAVVVTFPLLGVLLLPCAAVAPSSELAKATPEYSRMEKRKMLPLIESEAVTVLEPPAIFSA